MLKKSPALKQSSHRQTATTRSRLYVNMDTMLIDYHVHNHFSPDSEADTRDILREEMARGVREICLTNHVEWFNREEGIRGTFEYQESIRRFRSIEWEIEHLQPEFQNLTIKLGCELQYVESWMDGLARFVAEIPLDCALGSMHIVDDVVISSHKHVDDLFGKQTEEYSYTRYFEGLLKLVEWGHFDIAAHFDVIKKYGTKFYGAFQPEKYKPVIQKILSLMAKKGIGLELNTGSLHKRCEELFPHPEILRWAIDAGVEHFTLSSDAHEAALAGKFVHEALVIAKEVGIREITTYEKRKTMKHAI